MNALVVQKILHHSVARLATGFVIDLLDQLKNGSFCFLCGVLAVLPVVVIGIREYIHVLEKPVDSEAL